MALLNKLFTGNRKFDNVIESRDFTRSYKITSEQVRLLLFKESDWRGRKLLFDSSTIEKVPLEKNGKPLTTKDDPFPFIEISDGFAYKCKGSAPDASSLGDMIFGAVAMNYRGVSLKIHIMDEPMRLMCTKVFCVPVSRKTSRVERKLSVGEQTPERKVSSNVLPGNRTQTMLPSHTEESLSLSLSFERGDSGFYGESSPNSSISSTYDYCTMFDMWDGVPAQEDFSFFNSPPGSRNLSACSAGSWQRRPLRKSSTKFQVSPQSEDQLTVPQLTSNPASCESQMYSNSTCSGTSDSLSSASSSGAQRKNKLGLALLVNLSDKSEMAMLQHCMEHSPQLEALVSRLRLAVMLSGIQQRSGHGFIATLHQATADATQWLDDLMNGPRLPPLWLNLVTSQPPAKNKMAEALLSDLCFVLATGDTKHTNFFISTLLTHVLTYHLGWVSTVSPYKLCKETLLSPCAQDEHNALWTQLSDLSGSIGCPPRAAKTVLCGTTNTPLLKRILCVLTYFIRCGEVQRTAYQPHDLNFYKFRVESVPANLSVDKFVNYSVNSKDSRSVSGMKRTATHHSKLVDLLPAELAVNSVQGETDGGPSVSNFRNKDPNIMHHKSFAKTDSLSNVYSKVENLDSYPVPESPASNLKSSNLKRKPTVMQLMSSSDSSLDSSISDRSLVQQKDVVFVLGDDDKLVGLKNKSNGGKSVKKSSKTAIPDPNKLANGSTEEAKMEDKTCVEKKEHQRSSISPSKCCGQQLQHSKPIKHSGFKFEFDKYPQIVTNYMKSKNLEILDRHYIGKPGNLKLDNFQFDPTVVPPIQEERCEICCQCQQMETTLQTPTNASELEFMSDMPGHSEPQYARVKTTTLAPESTADAPPKAFVRKRKENIIVVNVAEDYQKNIIQNAVNNVKEIREEKVSLRYGEKVPNPTCVVKVEEIPLPSLLTTKTVSPEVNVGFHCSLLGGLTDHYRPDMVLQGTVARPSEWEKDMRRDLDLLTHLSKTLENPVQALGIVANTDKWEVRVLGPQGGSVGAGMSALVGTVLDALPHMWRARVPAAHCLSFLEFKLREFCVLSKTLSDMLMSTDFCDMATLTKTLNIDMNDVPFLLAVAATHTPQVARRYGISYR